MQFIGKLMRKLDEPTLEAVKLALTEQNSVPAPKLPRCTRPNAGATG
jgi:ribosomal 50S subunit-associated protein YjgA (DUF615 family)